ASLASRARRKRQWLGVRRDCARSPDRRPLGLLPCTRCDSEALDSDVITMTAKGQRLGRGCRPLVLVVAVGQTNTILDFLCVCHRVTILGRAISVAESPVRPAGSLSRGQPKWLLSNSYKGFGLSDSLRPEHQSARGPSALSLS